MLSRYAILPPRTSLRGAFLFPARLLIFPTRLAGKTPSLGIFSPGFVIFSVRRLAHFKSSPHLCSANKKRWW